MKESYDLLFITPCPSFYKVNLFNEVSNRKSVFVVFTQDNTELRNEDFYDNKFLFRHCTIPHGHFDSIWRILIVIIRTNYRQVVLDGWDIPERLIIPFISRVKKNACIVESSIYERKTNNPLKTLLKRLFLKRISIAYCSGKAQEELVKSLGYRRKVVQFGGCGPLNYIKQPQYEKRAFVRNFLYVGRLATEKNLLFLIEVFNELPQFNLSIIGYGPQERELKEMANENVFFVGAVPNKELPRYYQKSDVFVLPSISEPWGLVVEEALNNGLPVIVSNRVGCKDDLVTPDTGLVFDYNDKSSLKNNISKISDVDYYNRLRLGVSRLDFMSRSKRQVESFTSNV